MRILWVVILSVIPQGAAPAIDVPDGFVFKEDIAYGIDSERQRLDILYPENPETPLPAIIHIHGGGWYTGGKGGERTFNMMRTFAEAGFVSLSIEYRLSDEAPFPAGVEDCKSAIRWLRSHAEEYGIDPTRIGALGASAGGHLSAMLAVTGPEDGFDGDEPDSRFSARIQAAVPICAPLDLRVPISDGMFEGDDPVVVRFLGGPLSEKMDAAKRASPITYVKPGLPPLLLVHGTADRRVHISQSEGMAEALEKVSSSCELLPIEGGNHGMGIVRDEPEVLRRVVEFFERHLKNDR